MPPTDDFDAVPDEPGQPKRVRGKREAVVLETPRYRITGEIMLPPEGYRSRLSDHLNEPDREFLIVLDARLTPLDDYEGTYRVNVLMVQRDRIDVMFPASEAIVE